MPAKLRQLYRTRGFWAAVAFVMSRLFRVETHLVFYNDDYEHAVDVAWDSDTLVVEASSADDLASLGDYRDVLPDSVAEYTEAIATGQASGLFVFVHGQLAHWSFLLTQTRTLCYLGFSRGQPALMAAMFTVPSFRRRGLQTRAIMHLTNMAHRAGNEIVVAETSPDNQPSARAMKSGGMKSAGTLHFAVLCMYMVVRWKQPWFRTWSIGFCGRT